MINIIDMIKKAAKKKVVDEDVEATAPARGIPSASSFSVYDANGNFVRAYTVEDHGKDASNLANQFALKINGEVK